MVFPGTYDCRSIQAELRRLQNFEKIFSNLVQMGIHTSYLIERVALKFFIETDDMIGWSGSLFDGFRGHGVCYYIPYGSSVPFIKHTIIKPRPK